MAVQAGRYVSLSCVAPTAVTKALDAGQSGQALEQPTWVGRTEAGERQRRGIIRRLDVLDRGEIGRRTG